MGCCEYKSRRGRNDTLITSLFKVMLLYVVLMVTGGTLINTQHPVAAEAGKLIHTVTLVDPLIGWTHTRGFHSLAEGLDFLARGFPVDGVATRNVT